MAWKARVREIEKAGGKALVLPTDVASPEQVEAAAQAVEEKLRAHRYLDQQRHGFSFFADQRNDSGRI